MTLFKLRIGLFTPVHAFGTAGFHRRSDYKSVAGDRHGITKDVIRMVGGGFQVGL